MLKYNHKAFLIGVPARDLTDDEVRLYGKRKLLDSGAYAEPKPAKIHKLETANADEVNNGTGN